MQTTIFEKSVEYEESGQGLPLVLIHGYPLNLTMWEPQLRGLAEVAHVIAPNLSGFGKSDPVADVNMGSYADQIRELLDSLGVTEPAVLCGLSMGGYVVFEYLRRYPNHVRGLIFANTKAGADSPEARVGRDNSAATARAKGAEAIAEAMLPKMLSPKTTQNNPQLVQRAREMMSSASKDGIVAALMAMKDRPNSTDTMVDLHKPTLIITGADDQLIPPSESENLARGITDSRLEILPDAGHLSNLEQPELFNHAVREFLRSLG